jgi:hypothetical protein
MKLLIMCLNNVLIIFKISIDHRKNLTTKHSIIIREEKDNIDLRSRYETPDLTEPGKLIF